MRPRGRDAMTIYMREYRRRQRFADEANSTPGTVWFHCAVCKEPFRSFIALRTHEEMRH